jgi:hypothetical protein
LLSDVSEVETGRPVIKWGGQLIALPCAGKRESEGRNRYIITPRGIITISILNRNPIPKQVALSRLKTNSWNLLMAYSEFICQQKISGA